MCQDYKDRCQVHWVNTGATFPHIPLWIAETCDKLGYDLKEISAPEKQPMFSYVVGFPADIVPTDALPVNRMMDRKREHFQMQPWSSCCSQMIWEPLQNAAMESDATLILRGQKKSDERWLFDNGVEWEGKEFLFPLAECNHTDIFAYLAAHESLDIPEHYHYGCKEGLDCWMCTAFFDKAKMKYMQDKYPVLHDKLKDLLTRMMKEIRQCRTDIKDIAEYVDQG